MARPTLDRNVKFKRLCRELGLPKPYVRGLLETMWDCAHECGNPILGDATDVEAAAEWPGAAGVFAALVVEVGFVDRNPDGEHEIHDYWDHAPEYVQKRRKRELQREANGAELEHSADNGRQRQTTADNGQPPAPAPAPAPLDDESSTSDETVGPEPEADSGPSAVLSFPVTGKNGGEWPLSQAYLGELQTAFPTLDILAEARKARAWIVGNPSRRKTPKGMTRFLYGWMERCQNRGAATIPGRPPDRDYSAELAQILREQNGGGNAA